MRKTIATLGVVGLGLMSAAVAANAAPPEEKKITICHATSAAGNTFVVETINLSALKAHADDTLRHRAGQRRATSYPDGQNLSSANLAFLANSCVAVVPPVDPPVDTRPLTRWMDPPWTRRLKPRSTRRLIRGQATKPRKRT